MKTVAFVPVKLNNERLPGKNIKAFDNGKPLVRYILDTLSGIKYIDEIYCSCSDEAILKYLPQNVKWHKRDSKVDLQSATANDFCKAFCSEIDADIYVQAHATAPFITAKSVENGIEAVLNGGYDSAFSATENREFLWQNGKANYDVANIPRTQDMQPFYIESCAFWIFHRNLILERNRRIGTSPAIIPVSKIEAIDIDYPIDFEIANAIYNNILAKTE
jgi:CMP-N-acetylneuraminic acid synthetase